MYSDQVCLYIQNYDFSLALSIACFYGFDLPHQQLDDSRLHECRSHTFIKGEVEPRSMSDTISMLLCSDLRDS